VRRFLAAGLVMLGSAIVAPPAPAGADTIAVSTSTGGLYLVDTETLVARRIADTVQMFDIAVSEEGTFYGVTGGGDLWRIDPEGGKHVLLGNTGVFVNALVMDDTTLLLGAGDDGLYLISTRDGRADLFERLPGFSSSGDLAMGPDADLYATGSPGPRSMDTLYRIDPRTLEIIAIGEGIGFRGVYGLVWSDTIGRLFGVTEARELIEIDAATGRGVLLGVLDIDGLGYGAARLRPGLSVISGLAPGAVAALSGR